MASLGRFLQDYTPGWIGLFLRGFYLFFLLVPFAVAISVSFSPLVVFPPNGFTIKWYVRFFTSELFINGWKISFLLALAAASISTFVGTCFALGVTRYNFPGKTMLTNLTLSPLIVPGVATGVGLVFFFTYVGLVSGWARLVIAHIIITAPYVVRVVVATLYGFERSLEEAAMNLGATEARAFLTITLPVAKPGLIAGFLFAFMVSFENLPATVFVVQPGTYTLPVILFGYIRDEYNPIVAVVTVAMMAVSGLTMFLADRWVGINRFMGLHARNV